VVSSFLHARISLVPFSTYFRGPAIPSHRLPHCCHSFFAVLFVHPLPSFPLPREELSLNTLLLCRSKKGSFFRRMNPPTSNWSASFFETCPLSSPPSGRIPPFFPGHQRLLPQSNPTSLFDRLTAATCSTPSLLPLASLEDGSLITLSSGPPGMTAEGFCSSGKRNRPHFSF